MRLACVLHSLGETEHFRTFSQSARQATDTVIRDEAAAEPWMLKVVSSEGNFATLKSAFPRFVGCLFGPLSLYGYVFNSS